MGALFDPGIFSVVGLAGEILPGASIAWYEAGTSTPLDTYSDAALTVANPNPVPVGNDGRLPPIWLQNEAYKLVLLDEDGVPLGTRDDIEPFDLSGPTGSSQVGYLPAGTGAVASTVQTKLRERVSVKDFGATGDGTTDDTDAINTALAHCKLTFAKLYFPAGKYIISETLLVDWAGWSFEGDGFARTIIEQTAAVPGMILNGLYGEWRGMSLHGGPNSSTHVGTIGAIFRNVGESRFYDFACNWWSSDGIQLDTAYGGGTYGATGNNNLLKLWGGFCNENGGRGINALLQADNNGVELHGVTCNGNLSDGLLLRSEGWHIFGGIFEGNSGYGIRISLPGDAGVSVNSRIISPWIESNALGGVHGDGNSQRNMVMLSNRAQGYTAAVGSADVLEYYETFGKVTGDGTVGAVTGVLSGRAAFSADGAAANIDVWLVGKGSGSKFHLGISATPFSDILRGTAAFTGASMATGTSASTNITVTGAALGDRVMVSNSAALPAGFTLTGTVSAANTVTAVVTNNSGGTTTPTSGTLTADVWKS
jgi:hypothetical protein